MSLERKVLALGLIMNDVKLVFNILSLSFLHHCYLMGARPLDTHCSPAMVSQLCLGLPFNPPINLSSLSAANDL